MTVRDVVQIYGIVVIAYLAVLNVDHVVLAATAWPGLGRYLRARDLAGADEVVASPLTPAISVIRPVRDEAPAIAESVRTLLALRFPRHEVIVVNDGSTDCTMDELTDAFDLVRGDLALRSATPHGPVRAAYLSRTHPELVVLDKLDGGRADALNAGTAAAQHAYVCAVGAGAVLEPDALLRAAAPLLDDPDRVVAAGGNVRVANGCRVEGGRVTSVGLPRNRLATLQVVEYHRAFLAGRVGWRKARSLLVTSDAFGLFRRSAVEAVGGWRTGTVGGDVELVVRLHRHFQERDDDHRIAFVPDAVCWIEVPERLGALARQRRRWQRGLADTLWWHRAMAVRPRSRRWVSVATPYFILFEIIRPVLTVASYPLLPLALVLGLTSTVAAVAVLVFALVTGQLVSIAALALEELPSRHPPRWREVARLVCYAAGENLGYRQLTDLWRLQGTADALRRSSDPDEVTRRPVATSPAATLDAPGPNGR